MKKRGYILTGILLLMMTLLGCSNDKNTQPVFGDNNKAYEGFTYLESAILENQASNQEAVIYMLKSTDSYAIDEKSFSSNNGLSLNVELNTVTYDETKSLKDNLTSVVETKTAELEESKSNTLYLPENKEVWSDDTKAIVTTDYIWENTLREEYTYKQHYYCLYKLDEQRQALVELCITENEVTDEELLKNVLSEIEAYYGVHVDYNQETITAKKDAYEVELARIKEEEELAKLTHEVENYTFRLPEGYEMQMSYDDLGMTMYGKDEQNVFLVMNTKMEVADEEMTDFEQLDEEELNKLVKEQLQTQSEVDDMEFEKIDHDVLGTVLKANLAVTENNTTTYGVMFLSVKNGQMSMAMASSPDEAAANECAKMYIDSLQIKSEKEE